MVPFLFNLLKLGSGLSEVVSKDRFVPGSLRFAQQANLLPETDVWKRPRQVHLGALMGPTTHTAGYDGISG